MEKPNKKDRIKSGQAVVYSALTLILLMFIVQAGFGMIVNIIKDISIYTKLQTVEREHKEALRINRTLRSELKSFNTSKSLESIARNNLKMAGPDEILLIINEEDISGDNRVDNGEGKKNISRRR